MERNPSAVRFASGVTRNNRSEKQNKNNLGVYAAVKKPVVLHAPFLKSFAEKLLIRMAGAVRFAPARHRGVARG